MHGPCSRRPPPRPCMRGLLLWWRPAASGASRLQELCASVFGWWWLLLAVFLCLSVQCTLPLLLVRSLCHRLRGRLPCGYLPSVTPVWRKVGYCWLSFRRRLFCFVVWLFWAWGSGGRWSVRFVGTRHTFHFWVFGVLRTFRRLTLCFSNVHRST